ncbi:hypothetical protein E4U61_000334 [Claviceps capensis]|nr:hypothetical protein E4U61_000334 [Claviceps capensis]
MAGTKSTRNLDSVVNRQSTRTRARQRQEESKATILRLSGFLRAGSRLLYLSKVAKRVLNPARANTSAGERGYRHGSGKLETLTVRLDVPRLDEDGDDAHLKLLSVVTPQAAKSTVDHLPTWLRKLDAVRRATREM